MDDSKILTLLWERAEQAIEALQKRFGKLLHRIAMNILEQEQDAQECENDTYLAVWNTVPPNRPEPLCPYICRIGRNLALKRLRQETAQKRCSKYDLSLEELENAIPGPCLEDTVSARELGRAIDRFLSLQSDENRNLFLRRYWFGDSVQDAASLLGISANAATVRLSRMRTQLKAFLDREGYDHA